jgi:hypothetical protein
MFFQRNGFFLRHANSLARNRQSCIWSMLDTVLTVMHNKDERIAARL